MKSKFQWISFISLALCTTVLLLFQNCGQSKSNDVSIYSEEFIWSQGGTFDTDTDLVTQVKTMVVLPKVDMSPWTSGEPSIPFPISEPAGTPATCEDSSCDIYLSYPSDFSDLQSNKKYCLEKDIDFSSQNETYQSPSALTNFDFKGCGYKILNLHLKNKSLFRSLSNSKVQDLIIDGGSVLYDSQYADPSLRMSYLFTSLDSTVLKRVHLLNMDQFVFMPQTPSLGFSRCSIIANDVRGLSQMNDIFISAQNVAQKNCASSGFIFNDINLTEDATSVISDVSFYSASAQVTDFQLFGGIITSLEGNNNDFTLQNINIFTHLSLGSENHCLYRELGNDPSDCNAASPLIGVFFQQNVKKVTMDTINIAGVFTSFQNRFLGNLFGVLNICPDVSAVNCGLGPITEPRLNIDNVQLSGRLHMNLNEAVSYNGGVGVLVGLWGAHPEINNLKETPLVKISHVSYDNLQIVVQSFLFTVSNPLENYKIRNDSPTL